MCADNFILVKWMSAIDEWYNTYDFSEILERAVFFIYFPSYISFAY